MQLSARPGTGRLPSPRILLVDDEEVIHVVFEDILERTNYELTCVGSTEAALERLKTDNFDLAIIDKNLPGLSGLELMRILHTAHFKLQFIMITAFGSLESAVEALELGACDFLPKPFKNPDAVVAKIDRALERHHLALMRDRHVAALKGIHTALRRLQQAHEELSSFAATGPEAKLRTAPVLDQIEKTQQQLRALTEVDE